MNYVICKGHTLLINRHKYSVLLLLKAISTVMLKQCSRSCLIITTNKSHWNSIIVSDISINFIEISNESEFYQTMKKLGSAMDLIIIDNLSYLLLEFEYREVLSILRHHTPVLSLVHAQLHEHHIIQYLQSLANLTIEVKDLECKQVLHFNVYGSFKREDYTFEVEHNYELKLFPYKYPRDTQKMYNEAIMPTSTFRLDLNEEEEKVRSSLPNPFMTSDTNSERYLKCDSDSDVDDDLDL